MPMCCQGASGLAGAGRKGGGGQALVFLGGSVATPLAMGREGGGGGGFCWGVLGGATSTRWQGRRVAVSVLRHCVRMVFL